MEKSRLPLFHKKSKGNNSNSKTTKQSDAKASCKAQSSNNQSKKQSNNAPKRVNTTSGKGAPFSGIKARIQGNNSYGIVHKNGKKDDNNECTKPDPSNNSSKEQLRSCVSISDELSQKVARKSEQIGHRCDVRESNDLGNDQCGNDVELHSKAQHANTMAAIYRSLQDPLNTSVQGKQFQNVKIDGGKDNGMPPRPPVRVSSISSATVKSPEHKVSNACKFQNNAYAEHMSSDFPLNSNNGVHDVISNDTFNMSSHFQQFRKYYEYDVTGQRSKTSTSSDPDSSPHHDYEDIDLIMNHHSSSYSTPIQNIAPSDVTDHSSQYCEKQSNKFGPQAHFRHPHYGVKRGPLPPTPSPPMVNRASPQIHHHHTAVPSVANSKTYHDFSTSSQNNVQLQKQSSKGHSQEIVSRSQSHGQEMTSRINSQDVGPRIRHSSSPCSRSNVSSFTHIPSPLSLDNTSIHNATGAPRLGKSKKGHYQPLLSSSSSHHIEGNYHTHQSQNAFPSPNSNISINRTQYSKNISGIKNVDVKKSKIVDSDCNTSRNKQQHQSIDTVDGYHTYESVKSDGYHSVPTDANQSSLGVGLIPTSFPRADNFLMIKKGSGHYGIYSTSTPPDSPLDIVIPPPGAGNYFEYPTSYSSNKENPDRSKVEEQTLIHCNTNGISNMDHDNYQHTGVSVASVKQCEPLYNTQQYYSLKHKAHHHSNKEQDLVNVYNKTNQLMDTRIYDRVADSEALDSENYCHQNMLDKNLKDYSTVILNGKESVVTPGDKGPSYGYIYNMDGRDDKYGVNHHLKSFSLPHGGEVICGDVYMTETNPNGEEISPVSPPYTPILPVSQQVSPRSLTQGFYSLYSGDYSSGSKTAVLQSPHFVRKHSFPSPSCGIRMAELRAKAQRRWSDPKSPNNYSGMIESYRNTPSPTGSTGSVHSYQSVPIDENMTTITEEVKLCREYQPSSTMSSIKSNTLKKYKAQYQHLLPESGKGFQNVNEKESGKIQCEKQNQQQNSTLTNTRTVEKKQQRNNDVIMHQNKTTKESFVKNVSNSCSTTCSNSIHNEDGLQIVGSSCDNNKDNLANFHKDKHYQGNYVSSASQQEQWQNISPNAHTGASCVNNCKDLLLGSDTEKELQTGVYFNKQIIPDKRCHLNQELAVDNQAEIDSINNEAVLNIDKENSLCENDSIEQSYCSRGISKCEQYQHSEISTYENRKNTTINNDNPSNNSSISKTYHSSFYSSNKGDGVHQKYDNKVNPSVPSMSHGNNTSSCDINMKKYSDTSDTASCDYNSQSELQGKESKPNRQSLVTRQQKSHQVSQTNSLVISVKKPPLKNNIVYSKNSNEYFENVSDFGVLTLEKGSEGNVYCDYNNQSLPGGENLSGVIGNKAKSENHNINTTSTSNKTKSSNSNKFGMSGMKSSKLKPPSSIINREKNNEKSGGKNQKEKLCSSNAGSLHTNQNKCDLNMTSNAKQTLHTTSIGQRDSGTKSSQTVTKPNKTNEKTNLKGNKPVSGFSKLKPPGKVMKSKGERLVENRISSVISKKGSVNKDKLQGEDSLPIHETLTNLDHKTSSGDFKPKTNLASLSTQGNQFSKTNLAESNTKHELEENINKKMTFSITSQTSKSPTKTPDSEKSSIGSERKSRMRSRVGSYSSLSSCDPMSSLPSSRCSSQLSVDSISSDTFEYDLPRSPAVNVEEALLALPQAEKLAINSSDTKPIDCINKAVNVHNEVDLRDNVSTCSSNNKSSSDVCKSNNHNNSADVSRDSIDSSAIHTANSDSINSVDSVCKDLEAASDSEKLIVGGSDVNSDVNQHLNSSTHNKDVIISGNVSSSSKAILSKSKSLSSSTSSESNISCTSTGATTDSSSNNKPKLAITKSQVPTRAVSSVQSKTSRLKKPSTHTGKKSWATNVSSKTSLPQAAKNINGSSKSSNSSNSSSHTAVLNKQSASKSNNCGNAQGNSFIACSKESKKLVFNKSFSRSNSSESNCSSKSTHSSKKGDISPSSPHEVNNSLSNYKTNKTTEKTSRLRVPQASKLQKPRTLRDINTNEQSGLSKIGKPPQQRQAIHKNKTNDNTPELSVHKNIESPDLKESDVNRVCNSAKYKCVALGEVYQEQIQDLEVMQGQKSSTTTGTEVTSLSEIISESTHRTDIAQVNSDKMIFSQTIQTEEKSVVLDSPEKVANFNQSLPQKTVEESSLSANITIKEKREHILLNNNKIIAPSSNVAENKKAVSIISKDNDTIYTKDINKSSMKNMGENQSNEGINKIDSELTIKDNDSFQNRSCYTQFTDKDNKVAVSVPSELTGNTGNLHSTTVLLSSSQGDGSGKVLSTNENLSYKTILNSGQKDTLSSVPSDTFNGYFSGNKSISREKCQLEESTVRACLRENENAFPPNDNKLNKCSITENVNVGENEQYKYNSSSLKSTLVKPQVSSHPFLVKPYSSLRKSVSPVQGHKNASTQSHYSNTSSKNVQGHENDSDILVQESSAELNEIHLRDYLQDKRHCHLGEKNGEMLIEEEYCVDSTNTQNKVNNSIVRPLNNTYSSNSTPEDQLSVHNDTDINCLDISSHKEAPASQYKGSTSTDSRHLRSCQVALSSTDYDLDIDSNSSQKKPSVRSLETDSETKLSPLEAQPTLVRCQQSEDISVRNSILQSQQIASINETSGLGSVAIACDINGVQKKDRTATEEPKSTIDCSVKCEVFKSFSDINEDLKINNQSQQHQNKKTGKTCVEVSAFTEQDKLKNVTEVGENVTQVTLNTDPKISLDHSSISGLATQVVTRSSGMENEIQKQEPNFSLTQPPRNNCHPAQGGLSSNVKEISMRENSRCEGMSIPGNMDLYNGSHTGYSVAPKNNSRTGLTDRCDVRDKICLENSDRNSQDKMDHKSSPQISAKDNQIDMKVDNKLVNCNKDCCSSVNPEAEIIGELTEVLLCKGDNLLPTITAELRSPQGNSGPLNRQEPHVINKCNMSGNIDNSQLNAAILQQEKKSVIESDNSALHKPLVVETQPKFIQQAELSQGLCDSNQRRCMQYDSYFVLNESSRYMTFPAEPFSPRKRKKMSLQTSGMQEPFEMKDQYIEDSYFGDPSIISDTLFCPTVLESPSTRERYSQVIPNGDMLNSLKLSESGYDSWKSQGSSSTACEVDDDPILGTKHNHINLIGQNLSTLSDDSNSSDSESINGTSSASVITTKTVLSVSEKENGDATSNDEDGKGIINNEKSQVTRGKKKDDYILKNGCVKVAKSKISAASRSSSESTLTSDVIKYLEWDTSYDNNLLANNKDSSSIEDLLESAELFTKVKETSESLERLLQDCDEISLYDNSFESGSLKKRLNFSGSDFALALHSMSKSPSEENVLDESHIPYQQQGKGTYNVLGLPSNKHSPGLLLDNKKMMTQCTIRSLDGQSSNIYDPLETVSKTTGCQEKTSRSSKKDETLGESNSNCETLPQQHSQKSDEKSEESISSVWPNGGDKYQWKEYNSKSRLIGNQSADQTNPLYCNDSIITDNLVHNTMYKSKNTEISQTSNHQHQVKYDKHTNTPACVQSLQTEEMNCNRSTSGTQSANTQSSVAAPGGLINVISGNDGALTVSEVMSKEHIVKEHNENGNLFVKSPLNHSSVHEPTVNSHTEENSINNRNSKSLHKCEVINDPCTSPVKAKAAFFEAGGSFLNERRKLMFVKRRPPKTSSHHSSSITPINLNSNHSNNLEQLPPVMGEQLYTVSNMENTSNRLKEGHVLCNNANIRKEENSSSGAQNEAGNQRFAAGLLNYRDKILKSKAQKNPHNSQQRRPSRNRNDDPTNHLLSLETMVTMGVETAANDSNQYEVNCDCCLETVSSYNSCASFSTDSYLDVSCHQSNDVSSYNATNEPFQESNITAKRHHSECDEINISSNSVESQNNNYGTSKHRPSSLTFSKSHSLENQDLTIATMMFCDSDMHNEICDGEVKLTCLDKSPQFAHQLSHEEFLKSRRKPPRQDSNSLPSKCKEEEKNSFVPNGTLILGSVKSRAMEKKEEKHYTKEDKNVNFKSQSNEAEQQKPSSSENTSREESSSPNNSLVASSDVAETINQRPETRFAASQIPWGQKRGSGGRVIEKLKMFQGEGQTPQNAKKPADDKGHRFGWNLKFKKNKH